MVATMSRNVMICTIALALGMMSATTARAGCFDECSASPPPTSVHHGAGVSGSSTGTLEWNIKSDSQYKSAIKFYSETRKGHEWPSTREMWLLNDYATHKFRLGCVPGEKICFGAWLTGTSNKTYWGVGHGNRSGCPDCCHTCGDTARPQTLTP
jgi:hypothetical protein